MAETTPGQLIQVVQFVGFMCAFRAADTLDPMLAGAAGALVVTWVTFVPCFVWIFLGAPTSSTCGNQHLTPALSGITAAVVGVVLNLALWFSLVCVFGQLDETRTLGIRLYQPEWVTADPIAVALAACLFTSSSADAGPCSPPSASAPSPSHSRNVEIR
jgi:chromate transporter